MKRSVKLRKHVGCGLYSRVNLFSSVYRSNRLMIAAVGSCLRNEIEKLGRKRISWMSVSISILIGRLLHCKVYLYREGSFAIGPSWLLLVPETRLSSQRVGIELWEGKETRV